MLMAGALAMYATTDVALLAPPPHRPQRPARKAKGGGRFERAMSGLRDEIASMFDERPWLPQVTRRYPF